MEEGGKNGAVVQDEKAEKAGDRSNNNSEEKEVKNVHKHTRLSLRSLSMNRSSDSPGRNGTRKPSHDRTSKLESNK